MHTHDLIRELRSDNGSKIVLLVADGLGGLPIEKGGRTELETANTPNLDAAVADGVCGLSLPVLPGITPGSGPGHLGLFGFDPLEHRIGRGILEALGINFAVGLHDICVRGNFVTLAADGTISDRRAGRPSTERCIAMVEKLRAIKIPGCELFVEPVKEHRFVLVIRAAGLGDTVNDTDPQTTGQAPLTAFGNNAASETTAFLVNEFIAQALKVLENDLPTNGATLRGFAGMPKITSMQELYDLRSAAIAVYPMYKGLARLVGMSILEAGDTLDSQIKQLKQSWNDFDFFFLHYKYTDSTGEDGNFAAKVKKIEDLDTIVPAIRALNPDVFIVTGDHSTPSRMKNHSFHPVPTLLVADHCRPDDVTVFGERNCLHGGLGQFEAKHLMLLAMGHAGRFGKYGA